MPDVARQGTKSAFEGIRESGHQNGADDQSAQASQDEQRNVQPGKLLRCLLEEDFGGRIKRVVHETLGTSVKATASLCLA